MSPALQSPRHASVYWIPWEDPGCEHLSLVESDEGIAATGLILRRRGSMDFRCRYELTADTNWCFQRLVFSVAGVSEVEPKRLLLESDADGWRANGELLPELTDCRDVDIQITPFTNSLPIRRLGLAEGESRDLAVVYVPVPELTPQRVEQRYSCLAPLGVDGGRYLYEGLFRDFTAELAVDAGGLVLDYPETFRRSWPT